MRNMYETTRLLLHFLLLASFILAPKTFATYTLAQDYSGANFYNGFQFFTEPDPTDGHVQFLSEAAANDTQIAGLMDGGNANMAVYLGVDSSNDAPNGRNSIRVTSAESFHHGLFIADIIHMPGGVCGTWPAFWMVGPNWPADGEIDIVEGVNDQGVNSMTLHTDLGVVVDNGTDFSGQLQTTNCDVNAPDQAQNAGCSIMDNSNLTFGTNFNAVGGGVYATEWTSQFIKIWFFQRGSIPADISNGSPSPSDQWGTPNSVFQGNFSMDDHFTNLNIVFDTTFCGAWAGAVWNDSSCASLAPTCEEYVTNFPSAFQDAYWAINTLQVFQDNGSGGNGTDTTSAVEAGFIHQRRSGGRRRHGGAVHST